MLCGFSTADRWTGIPVWKIHIDATNALTLIIAAFHFQDEVITSGQPREVSESVLLARTEVLFACLEIFKHSSD